MLILSGSLKSYPALPADSNYDMDAILKETQEMASARAIRVLEEMRRKTAMILRPVRELAVMQVPPEKPELPPMTLLSCRVPMGTRYIGRGENKRLLEEVC